MGANYLDDVIGTKRYERSCRTHEEPRIHQKHSSSSVGRGMTEAQRTAAPTLFEGVGIPVLLGTREAEGILEATLALVLWSVDISADLLLTRELAEEYGLFKFASFCHEYFRSTFPCCCCSTACRRASSCCLAISLKAAKSGMSDCVLDSGEHPEVLRELLLSTVTLIFLFRSGASLVSDGRDIKL